MPDPINQRLRIPRSTASQAFIEIARNIRANPVLSGSNGIKTWVVPGLEMDLPDAALDPKFVIDARFCPLLLLWPEPADGQPLTNVQQQARLSIRVSLYLDTTDPLDCLDYYGEIEKAVSPETVAEGQTLRARLQPITDWSGQIDIEQPGVSLYPSTQAPVMLAEGSVSTRYRINSY